MIAVILGAHSFPAAPADAVKEDVPDQEAAALVSELLSQQPPEELALEGRLKISNSKGTLARVQIKYTVRLHADRWEGIYEAGGANGAPVERLTVVHKSGSPNEYLYWRASDPKQQTGELSRLAGDKAAIPFGNSDYWLSDLGLEFLHWPKQRLNKDTIQMWNQRSCQVLESIHPAPNAANYARVLSWVDREYGGLIHAVAYDSAGRKVKVFSVRSFSKGQVTGMEILNQQTDTKSYLELQPQPK